MPTHTPGYRMNRLTGCNGQPLILTGFDYLTLTKPQRWKFHSVRAPHVNSSAEHNSRDST